MKLVSKMFDNSGMGQCVILKSEKDTYLVLALARNQYIVCSDIDENGSWLFGNYFDSDLDEALSYYNQKVNYLSRNKEESEIEI